jgi:hypothetical protein
MRESHSRVRPTPLFQSTIARPPFAPYSTGRWLAPATLRASACTVPRLQPFPCTQSRDRCTFPYRCAPCTHASRSRNEDHDTTGVSSSKRRAISSVRACNSALGTVFPANQHRRKRRLRLRRTPCLRCHCHRIRRHLGRCCPPLLPPFLPTAVSRYGANDGLVQGATTSGAYFQSPAPGLRTPDENAGTSSVPAQGTYDEQDSPPWFARRPKRHIGSVLGCAGSGVANGGDSERVE